jgi:putative ABC transport system permease protein
MQLFSVFSAIALLLAVTGIYGVMAFTVSRRTTEFGVRIALGAQRGDVLRMILLQAGRLAAIGVVIGVCGSLATGRFLASLLYRTNAWDLFMVGFACVLMLLVALIASFVPAWRATKVDPLIALRAE